MSSPATIAEPPSSNASQRNGAAPRRLILRSFQSPGDVLMLTAAVRDLQLAHPGKFQLAVRVAAIYNACGGTTTTLPSKSSGNRR